jgi:transcription-repair coupling factor (superfamily II helicase)
MIAHDSMGSSFELAVRDLEVRGAGNLLGREQSGVIKEIGLELYFHLLKEAIDGLKTTQGHPKTLALPLDPEIKIEAEALIPTSYMPQERERLYHYRRIATALDDQELDRFLEEMQDIYGEPPEQIRNLFTLKKVWIYAKKLGIQKILPTDKEILFAIHPDWHGPFGEACLRELSKDSSVRFSEEGGVYTKKDKHVSLIQQALLTLERWLGWMNRKEVMV